MGPGRALSPEGLSGREGEGRASRGRGRERRNPSRLGRAGSNRLGQTTKTPPPQYGASESAACFKAAGRASREAVEASPQETMTMMAAAVQPPPFCCCAGRTLLPPAMTRQAGPSFRHAKRASPPLFYNTGAAASAPAHWPPGGFYAPACCVGALMGVAKTGCQALCCRHRLGTESRIAWRVRRRACGAPLALLSADCRQATDAGVRGYPP